jgi:hypothetical protein
VRVLIAVEEMVLRCLLTGGYAVKSGRVTLGAAHEIALAIEHNR